MGAVLAAICLAPAAWADGQFLAKGEAPQAATLTAGLALPLTHALAQVRAALPHLIGSTLRASAQLGQPPGTHNGS
ncbi:MAG TPA: hypothetical protein VGM17_06725 [Rhizomicrobium sp.]